MQTITSAATSLNQMPALFKKIDWKRDTVNLDVGGGRYDKGTDWLHDNHNVYNYVYDPYNRANIYTVQLVQDLLESPADSATCANVLNVIDDAAARRAVIRACCLFTEYNAVSYFQVYEGDRSGVGKVTPKGWQENRKADTYTCEIIRVFPHVERKGNMIIARKGTS